MAQKKKSSKIAKEVAEDQAATEEVEEISQTPSDDVSEELMDATADTADKVEGARSEDDDVDIAEPVEENQDDTAPVEEPAQPDDTPETDTPDTESTPESATLAPVTNQPVVVRKGGFLPMLLGGAAAAAIGYGAAYFGLMQGQDDTGQATLKAEIDQQLQGQTSAIENLGSRIETLAKGPDLSGIEAAQSDLGAAVESLSTRIETAESQLSGMEDRLTKVEKRPIAEGASDAAVAAYERELKALQDSMAQQRAEIEAMTSDARQMEESAEEKAQDTMRRAALTRIQTALDAGTGFAPALADLEKAGVDAPAPLAQIADKGAPSLIVLQESFPEAARAALAVSRKAAGDESKGFGGFLKTQLGVRSLEPREGDDPDAILSRAEAALKEGRLTDALAEIEALPEVGRTELSDWAGQATRRLNAIAAAQVLGENLN